MVQEFHGIGTDLVQMTAQPRTSPVLSSACTGGAALAPTVATATESPMSSPCYDEMRSATGELRTHYRAFADWLERTSPDRIAQKR